MAYAEWLTDDCPIRVKEVVKAEGCGSCLLFLCLTKASLVATELWEPAQPPFSLQLRGNAVLEVLPASGVFMQFVIPREWCWLGGESRAAQK